MGCLVQLSRPVALALGGHCCKSGLPLSPRALPSSMVLPNWGPGSGGGGAPLAKEPELRSQSPGGVEGGP